MSDLKIVAGDQVRDMTSDEITEFSDSVKVMTPCRYDHETYDQLTKITDPGKRYNTAELRDLILADPSSSLELKERVKNLDKICNIGKFIACGKIQNLYFHIEKAPGKFGRVTFSRKIPENSEMRYVIDVISKLNRTITELQNGLPSMITNQVTQIINSVLPQSIDDLFKRTKLVISEKQ